MKIKNIDIIHHSHVDYGYTDHPAVVRILQKKYIDIALDAAISTMDKGPAERFCWTAEVLDPVWEWWRDADVHQRERLLQATAAGCFEVCGFPFNSTAFMDENQWDLMFRWIPEDLWQKLMICTGMQTDVNGLPLAGAARAYHKGIRYLWMGPNRYLGSVPFRQPSAFRWKMPETGELLVWLNPGYCNAFYLLNENWRKGPVPGAADLRYRAPGKGDFFEASRDAVLKAHDRCLRNIEMLESSAKPLATSEIAGRQLENTQFICSGGYRYSRLPVSLTNQWRMDNDPPMTHVVKFISQWNEMGLKPELRLTTPTAALDSLMAEITDELPVYEGEWVDWWAKGSISDPAGMAASRKAKRIVKALKSPFFSSNRMYGSMQADHITKELCLFDEHTWGSWKSVAYPYSCASTGEMHEKSCLAYRPLALAEYLLAEEMRNKYGAACRGVLLANPTSHETCDWVRLPSDCLRGEYAQIRDDQTGEKQNLAYETGEVNFSLPKSADDFSMENVSSTFRDHVPGKTVRFWSGNLHAGSVRHFTFLKDETLCNPSQDMAASGFQAADDIKRGAGISKDTRGWPVSILWDSTPDSALKEGFGDFLSLRPDGFAPRWILKDIINTEDERVRINLISQYIKTDAAGYQAAAIFIDDPHMVVIKQAFNHPSLVWAIRTVEIWRHEPRVRLSMKICRQQSMKPETFFIRFPMPHGGSVPLTSNGGRPFRPGIGQLPGSCMDYYAIDGWVMYQSAKGYWLWTAKDSPMITFGMPKQGHMIKELPEQTNELYAMVFDNTWDTNFVADSHGIMEFQFNIVWGEDVPDGGAAAKLAETLDSEPIAMVFQ